MLLMKRGLCCLTAVKATVNIAERACIRSNGGRRAWSRSSLRWTSD